MKKLLIPQDKSIWTGRPADTLQYWHQKVTCLELDSELKEVGKNSVGLLGYAVDEGVKRNMGRLGAALGPKAIRKSMAGMAYHLLEELAVYDFGNVICENEALEDSQEVVCERVKNLLKDQAFPVLLGGGHDLAYAHGKGILEYLAGKEEKLGIINLDAHFDLREKNGGKGHSGSPFLQLAENYPDRFRYLALGIQKAANPPMLFQTAKSIKAQWMEMEEFTLDNWHEINLLLDSFAAQVNKIYLSIDLDGFASAFAPGVSAPSPMGFSPELAFKVLKWIAQSGKLISMDVVELNPRFDQDQQTARLAARCIEYVLRWRR